MKPVVIAYKPLPEDLHQRLSRHAEVTEIDGLTDENCRKHAELLRNAQGIIGASNKFDKAIMDFFPALKVASTASAGYDQFDVAEMSARGILLMHTPDALTDTVADLMMGLMLTAARRMVEMDNRVRSGEWTASAAPDWYGSDVHHKTLGIVGMGRIGMALAQRGHNGFAMPVLYHARHRHPQAEAQFGAEYRDLDALLAEADFVCIILPLSEQTRHLIDGEKLAKMKPGAILINGGRGPVVDEPSLIAALESRRILAAGLDVYEHEPLAADSPLRRLPNVVLMPHMGSATHETRHAMAAAAVDNLITALTGRPRRNCVNPQILDK
ncbi:glyoxylate/hydroxypyruvate reductase GhrB [Martelella alba]|uniref:Glyoxylate/hydroxypyruvate reductase GhrB n=1 Tax=Martelella alba TaxID=2590451 RepID=A0ABY2SND5_9HYPH|nr:glyoxylate/hydroxypyruvate reductase GhrB [Martelella alba]TKI07274.1 glyoxylate/hydroxypyruvate reductase GhrB [Martelella alba]